MLVACCCLYDSELTMRYDVLCKIYQLQMHTAKVNGEDIAYLEFNPQQKKTVVFVHGTFSSTVWWKQTIDTIKPNTRILAIDLRGFGHSSNHKHVTCLDDFASDVG